MRDGLVYRAGGWNPFCGWSIAHHGTHGRLVCSSSIRPTRITASTAATVVNKAEMLDSTTFVRRSPSCVEPASTPRWTMVPETRPTTQVSHQAQTSRVPGDSFRLAVILIERLDELQMQRPWVPWWALDQPQNGYQPPAR